MGILSRILVLLATFVSATNTQASVVSYEGDVFPEVIGWHRETSLLFADRSLHDGWLIQQADSVPYAEFQVDEDDFYRRRTTDFAGSDEFFVEWRTQADGPREGFPNVSPASIVIGRFMSGLAYHFTIANDGVAFGRGFPQSPPTVLFVDIEPDLPHTYRLELFEPDSYRWLIDGQLIEEGTSGRSYWGADSEIVFGARAAGEPITARWDYIRYGTIPEPTTMVLLLIGSCIAFRRHRSIP